MKSSLTQIPTKLMLKLNLSLSILSVPFSAKFIEILNKLNTLDLSLVIWLLWVTSFRKSFNNISKILQGGIWKDDSCCWIVDSATFNIKPSQGFTEILCVFGCVCALECDTFYLILIITIWYLLSDTCYLLLAMWYLLYHGQLVPTKWTKMLNQKHFFKRGSRVILQK